MARQPQHVGLNAEVVSSDPRLPTADNFADQPSEHIVIDGDDSADIAAPRNITDRAAINNRLRNRLIEVLLYQEGYARVRIATGRKPAKESLLELQFVDPRWRVRKRSAARWLWLAIVAVALTVGAYGLLSFASVGTLAISAMVVGGTAGLICFLMFLHRREERLEFYTKHGRAKVLTLTSSTGCVKKTRRTAAKIAAAARDAARAGDRGELDLRAEMRAHYALRDRGIITAQICSASTAKILARFG